MTTPSALECFLQRGEKDRFNQWRGDSRDRSLVSFCCAPAFTRLAKHVPEVVAPNVLSLTGVVALSQAWYFCSTYSSSLPSITVFVAIVALLSAWIASAVADSLICNSHGNLPMDELFKYVSNLASSIFFVLILCELLSIAPDRDEAWYCVQVAQMALLWKHYSAFMRGDGLRHTLVGPGEVVVCSVCLLAAQDFYGLSLEQILELTCGRLNLDRAILSSLTPRTLYLSSMYLAIGCIATANLLFRDVRKHAQSHRHLVAILACRGLGGYLRSTMREVSPTSAWDILCDGFFMATVNADIILAKMSGRDIHGIVVLMAALTALPNMHWATVGFVAFYHISVFGDLRYYLDLPLFKTVRNVYCDGIFDLCNASHKSEFQRAAALGNRLLVGVVSDQDTKHHKWPPVMSAIERETEVAGCKAVYTVIRNAPCFGISEDFIREHRIHKVVIGQEYADGYDPDDDPFYKVPRKMGIAVPITRAEGKFAADLIKRVQERGVDQKKSPT